MAAIVFAALLLAACSKGAAYYKGSEAERVLDFGKYGGGFERESRDKHPDIDDENGIVEIWYHSFDEKAHSALERYLSDIYSQGYSKASADSTWGRLALEQELLIKSTYEDDIDMLTSWLPLSSDTGAIILQIRDYGDHAFLAVGIQIYNNEIKQDVEAAFENRTHNAGLDEVVSAREYYAGVLEDFLALGKQNITVILRDVDGDGFDELLTYWQEDVHYPADNAAVKYISELNYGLDIYDVNEGNKLHFTEEKTEQIGDNDISSWHDPDNTVFITDNGYLAFRNILVGEPHLPGWVYVNSAKHSISGGSYLDYASIEPVFDDKIISRDEFKEVCSQFGLKYFDSDTLLTYEAGRSIFPDENTESTIKRVLGWDYVFS
jgi:hypothetical protein